MLFPCGTVVEALNWPFSLYRTKISKQDFKVFSLPEYEYKKIFLYIKRGSEIGWEKLRGFQEDVQLWQREWIHDDQGLITENHWENGSLIESSRDPWWHCQSSSTLGFLSKWCALTFYLHSVLFLHPISVSPLYTWPLCIYSLSDHDDFLYTQSLCIHSIPNCCIFSLYLMLYFLSNLDHFAFYLYLTIAPSNYTWLQCLYLTAVSFSLYAWSLCPHTKPSHFVCVCYFQIWSWCLLITGPTPHLWHWAFSLCLITEHSLNTWLLGNGHNYPKLCAPPKKNYPNRIGNQVQLKVRVIIIYPDCLNKIKFQYMS